MNVDGHCRYPCLNVTVGKERNGRPWSGLRILNWGAIRRFHVSSQRFNGIVLGHRLSFREPLEPHPQLLQLHPPTILEKVPQLNAHSQVNIKLSFNHITVDVVVTIVVSLALFSISFEGSQSLHEQIESISEEERRRGLRWVEEER